MKTLKKKRNITKGDRRPANQPPQTMTFFGKNQILPPLKISKKTNTPPFENFDFFLEKTKYSPL
jgi:hypothetical protein